MVLNQKTIAVFPDRVEAPFSVALSSGQFSATAVRADSPQAFLDAVANEACGVAFHAITIAEGVARVATTLYLPHGRIANQVWISLYRHQGGTWVPLQVPSHPMLHRMLNEPNLLPTINRNYGADDPLKRLRLDLTMERIRVDLKASRFLDQENIDNPGTSHSLDASYIPLLDKYKRADSLAVKYTAEYQLFKLGAPPDIQLWIDTLVQQQRGTPYHGMAQQVVAGYVSREIETEGRKLTGRHRRRLVAAALTPPPADHPPSPRQRLRPENIRDVRASRRFGLVDVAFRSGPMGGSGYSMLFERRGKYWVFLCIAKGWIS
jgi:hypothetical protein